MILDYSYCLNEDTCIHRRGCKRWLGNYNDESVKELHTKNAHINEINFKECIPNCSDINCENDFQHLDRFRLNDGSEMK